MSFLDRLFGKRRRNQNSAPVRFGRFNEGLRTAERNKAWDQAMELFEASHFLDSLEFLFTYLNDPEDDNLNWVRRANKIEFTLLQGSMQVKGWANPLEFQAQAEVCKFGEANEGLFRSLLAANYDLTYCKYVLQDKTIVLKFNSHTLDASPHKVYQGLRELSLLSDKQDDLIQGEFGQELSMNVATIQPLPGKELAAKTAFLDKQLSELADDYNHCALDQKEYAGAYAYLLLNTCYKLDYLLRPEGELMDLFEKVHRGYFGPSGAMTIGLNQDFFKQIQETGRHRLEEIPKECYLVKYTFGYTQAVSRKRVQSFVLEEVEKMDWYIREGHREIGLAIPGYIVGYSLFHYALPAPLTELFGLYYEVIDADFFVELGIAPSLMSGGRLLSKQIIERIQRILKPYGNPGKAEITKQLRFDSIYHFTKSYLLMIGQLNLT